MLRIPPLIVTIRVTEGLHALMQVSGEKEFFAEMVVEAVSKLDPATLDMNMLGTKKVCSSGTLVFWRTRRSHAEQCSCGLAS